MHSAKDGLTFRIQLWLSHLQCLWLFFKVQHMIYHCDHTFDDCRLSFTKQPNHLLAMHQTPSVGYVLQISSIAIPYLILHPENLSPLHWSTPASRQAPCCYTQRLPVLDHFCVQCNMFLGLHILKAPPYTIQGLSHILEQYNRYIVRRLYAYIQSLAFIQSTTLRWKGQTQDIAQAIGQLMGIGSGGDGGISQMDCCMEGTIRKVFSFPIFFTMGDALQYTPKRVL